MADETPRPRTVAAAMNGDYSSLSSPMPTPAWPASSATSLPPLCDALRSDHDVAFPINEECTSLCLSPSGRLLLGGFSDGTLRIFDLTGTYRPTSTTTTGPTTTTTALARGGLVSSIAHQQYGAVAAQIHAKGVHTSLLMDVDVAEDGQWAFCGVLRGSMEMVAVYLGHLEASFASCQKSNLLDHVDVYRHADAKLRGFGACTRLQSQERYLLLTGKAIKNIHIWSFTPPTNASGPIWQQLYDTQTNGNTIKLLRFRRDPIGHLQALSKSDGQKLRVWDVHEEEQVPPKQRPSRPAFFDVANSEAALGLAGGFCLCGGSDMFNQMSIVDVDHRQEAVYNHTELALPGCATRVVDSNSRRRQQRGDLKSVESVAGLAGDAGQALLELSNGSLVQYTHEIDGGPVLRAVARSGLCDMPEGWSRQVSVARVAAEGVAVGAVAVYSSTTGQGSIVVWPLEAVPATPRAGFWGFLAPPSLPRLMSSPAAVDPPLVSGPAVADDVYTVTTAKKADASRPSSRQFSLSARVGQERFSDDPTSFVTPQVVATRATRALSTLPVARKLERVETRSPAIPTPGEETPSVADRPALKSLAAEQTPRLADQSKENTPNGAPSNRPTKFLKTNDSTRTASSEPPRPSPPIPRKRSSESDNPQLDLAEALCQLSKPVRSPAERDADDTVSISFSPRPVAHSRTAFKLDSLRSPTRSRKNDPVARERLRRLCRQQRAQLQSMLADFGKSTVSRRMQLHKDPPATTLAERHEHQRRLLAAEHRALHERTAKMLLRAASALLRSIERSPTSTSVDDAERFWTRTVAGFRASIEDMIAIQQLQAEGLAATQSFECGQETPALAVEFQFPHVMLHASASLADLKG